MSLLHDFLTEWHRFATGTAAFKGTVKEEYFPYFTQGTIINIKKVELDSIYNSDLLSATPAEFDPEDHPEALTTDLPNPGKFEHCFPRMAQSWRGKRNRRCFCHSETLTPSIQNT